MQSFKYHFMFKSRRRFIPGPVKVLTYYTRSAKHVVLHNVDITVTQTTYMYIKVVQTQK